MIIVKYENIFLIVDNRREVCYYNLMNEKEIKQQLKDFGKISCLKLP